MLAILLPVAGVAARWTNFLFDRSIPSGAVLAASVQELAATGFAALSPAVPLFALGGFLSYVRIRPEPARDEKTQARLERLARWTYRGAIAAWVALTVYAILTFDFPAGLAGFALGAFVGQTYGQLFAEARRDPSAVSLRRFLPPALVLIALSGLIRGLNPGTAPQVDADFTQGTTLPSSTYLLLGESDYGVLPQTMQREQPAHAGCSRISLRGGLDDVFRSPSHTPVSHTS